MATQRGKDGNNRKRPTRFTKTLQAQFLEYVRKCGFVSRAAESVGVRYQTIRYHAKQNDDFQKAIDEALLYYTESLEIEADRRGKEGIEKPIFYQGEKVDTVKEYSDQLLMFRLKALRPDKYRERVDQNVTGDLKIEIVQFGSGDESDDE